MNQVTLFLNRINTSEPLCSFKLGLMITRKNVSVFLRVLAFDGCKFLSFKGKNDLTFLVFHTGDLHRTIHITGQVK